MQLIQPGRDKIHHHAVNDPSRDQLSAVAVLILQQYFVIYSVSSLVVAGPGAVLVVSAPARPGPCGGSAGGCGDQVCQEAADPAECDPHAIAARAFGALAAVSDGRASASYAKAICPHPASYPRPWYRP